MVKGTRRTGAALMVGLTCVLAGMACDAPELRVPSSEDVEDYYTIVGESTVTVRGNVAQLEVHQASEQLARGGRLWARVGPYIYLFSEPTRRLFEDYDGLAAVRVITRDPAGDEVARATLERDALNAVTWRRALNIAGLARRDGTERPTLLEDLVEWGEEHTTYEYSEAYEGSP